MELRMSPERKAALLCVVVNLMETFSGLCAQQLQDHIPPLQLSIFRFSTQFIICAILVAVLGLSLKREYPEVMPTLMVCAGVMLYNLGFYMAASRLPLGLLTALLNVSEAIAIIILHKLLLNTSVPVLKVVIFPFIFLGLFLMVTPSLLLEHVFISTYVEGIILVTIAGMSMSLTAAIVQTKCQGIHGVVLGFWYTATGTIVSTLLSIYLEQCQTTLTLRQGLFLLGHSTGAASAGMVALFIYKRGQLITWAVINSSRIILNFILQKTVMKFIVPVPTGSIAFYFGMAFTLIGITYSVGYDICTEGINDVV